METYLRLFYNLKKVAVDGLDVVQFICCLLWLLRVLLGLSGVYLIGLVLAIWLLIFIVSLFLRLNLLWFLYDY